MTDIVEQFRLFATSELGSDLNNKLLDHTRVSTETLLRLFKGFAHIVASSTYGSPGETLGALIYIGQHYTNRPDSNSDTLRQIADEAAARTQANNNAKDLRWSAQLPSVAA